MSDVGVDTFDYEAIPATGDQQREKVRELVRAYARDDEDQALLLDVLGFGDPPNPAHRPGHARTEDCCPSCGYVLTGRNHKRLCGPEPRTYKPAERRP